MTPVKHSFDAEQEREYLVSRYLDGTLDHTRHRAFEEQLQTDPALATLLDQYRALDALVKHSAGDVPEIDWRQFEAGIRRRRRFIGAAARPSPRVLKLFVPLAAAAAVAITFWLLHPPQHDGTTRIVRLDTHSTVRIARPAPATAQPEDVFVTYGYAPTASDESVPDPPSARTMVAMAAVGTHVHWPTIAGAPLAR